MSIIKVIESDNKQSVLIPDEFRFDTAQVSAQICNGGILLLPIREKVSLEDWFSLCDQLDADEKLFLDDRPCNVEVANG